MIAVAFWGLTRSTEHTVDSIKRHVFAHLPAHRVFLHTYKSDEAYANHRAGEAAPRVDAKYTALDPHEVEVDDLQEVKERLDLPGYRTHPDPWGTAYQTVDNFVLAMYSKGRVTEMVRKSGIDFAWVIFVRPDVRYLADVAPLLTLARPDAWVIPSFHLSRGFNDRFCIASSRNYAKYGNVLPFLLHYSRLKPLHSETFYADLARASAIRVVYAPSRFVFQRVRLGGQTDKRDLLLHEAVDRKRGDATDADHVNLHDGIFRQLSVLHTLPANFLVHRVGFVRKPARVVQRNVRLVYVTALLL